jgi:uncharacterized RDD family membrane protein YckC
MTCPTCGGELVPGADHCPVCDTSVAPRVEGALAADPRLVTPPARPKARVEPLRDIPGLRKRERTWRDEVQDRVRSRRQRRAEAGLPLFEEPEVPPQAARPEPPPEAGAAVPTRPTAPPVEERAVAPPVEHEGLPEPAPGREPDLVSTRLSEAELADLPLRASEEEPDTAPGSDAPPLDDDVFSGEPGLEPEVELAPPAVEPTPLERPARVLERLRAGVVDALLFGALAVVVLYFTGRAARVDLATLLSAWPALGAYLGLLALFYAGYFTGTTGQTPGKLMSGLRVVDASGRPPGYLRSIARAVVGLAGTALVGLGLLPMVFDPAARALHDRLFRTRVVHG